MYTCMYVCISTMEELHSGVTESRDRCLTQVERPPCCQAGLGIDLAELDQRLDRRLHLEDRRTLFWGLGQRPAKFVLS